jgi:RNA polymerase sigma-70 factor (ECF subfamily)
MPPLAEPTPRAFAPDAGNGPAPRVESAAAFAALYDQQVDFVWRAARRLGVEDADADDVVQEVFFVAHRRLGEFTGRATAKTWLFGILHNVVQHHRRSRARKHRHLLAGAPRLDPDRLPDARSHGPAESVEHAEAMRVLDGLLARLDDGKRAVFVLAEIEQLTANEIADALGINANTVYSRLRVARQEFERALARYQADEARRSP